MSDFPKFEACGNQIRTLREPNGGGGWFVAEVAVTHVEGEASKRATLFAASADLLEALEIIVGDIERSPRRFTPSEKVAIARAAIAKAEGR